MRKFAQPLLLDLAPPVALLLAVVAFLVLTL